MIIQHNISALNSHRQLGINNASTAKNLEKLSSGYRINRAGDDAAGLAISEKMRGQIRGLEMATQNAQNGVSLIQTAEGGLNETHAILQRMRELAVQSANGTYDDDVDRLNLDEEVQALKAEIDRIAEYTSYNGIKLLDGSLGGKKVDTAVNKTTGSQAKFLMGELGLGSAAFAITGGTGLKDINGTLIVRGSGATATFALQVGDQVIAGSANDATYADATGFGFTFEDGTKVTMSIDGAMSTKTGAKQGVITGVHFNAAGTAITLSDAMAGTKTSELTFQIGANGTADQKVGLHVDNMATGFLGNATDGYVAAVSVASQTSANAAIGTIDAAINQVSTQRAGLGALQNRLEHTINNLGVTRENLQSAESSIRDVDMAKEMMNFTKNNILSQAAQAMLAQANQLPQGILQLLR
ncbi:flagellin [Oscillospiraceae bacterium MB08-C2-2]|nr:flagellin [Oscillospiraceae bacterium MB08-C2-2]